MSHFNDNLPQYEFMSQHDENEGKIARKALWKMFWILLAITVAELIVGFQAEAWGMSKMSLKVLFIGATIAKAFGIVWSFMHLGHELKWLKWVVVAPFTFFVIYMISLIVLGEGPYSKSIRGHMDKGYFEQAQNGQHHAADPAEHSAH